MDLLGPVAIGLGALALLAVFIYALLLPRRPEPRDERPLLTERERRVLERWRQR